MTDLKLFRLDADGRDAEVQGSTVALEVDLQRRVEASTEAMLGIRFVASEYPTGPWHRGRIDSLGLDENGTPVIIEYKKGSDHGVVTQAVSYLSWLKSSRHEFQGLVQEKLGAEAAESIDWRNPRVVCIAADFFRHDRTAIHLMGQRIDLVRYRVFEGGLLSLLLVESAPGNAAPAAPRTAVDRAGEGPAGAPNSTETIMAEPPTPLRALYEELSEALTRSGDVEVEAKLHYIAFRRMRNLACVLFRPSSQTIMVYLRVDPGTVALEEGFTRDVRGIGHLGTGDLEVRIRSAADLERATPLIQQAFDAA
ncbi:DUF5655 domain-containing protein [Kitasatospora sp. NPDC049285]|uniref:DUF5655 domain-containing protein n=1 Tax=Kitasatospora sp. NPDC049285 TaxID=3157096 RepID=UPI003422A0D9